MIALRPNGDYIYREYMGETLDYNITIIPLTIIPFDRIVRERMATSFYCKLRVTG
jgi:hypothetical protein